MEIAQNLVFWDILKHTKKTAAEGGRKFQFFYVSPTSYKGHKVVTLPPKGTRYFSFPSSSLQRSFLPPKAADFFVCLMFIHSEMNTVLLVLHVTHNVILKKDLANGTFFQQ